MVGLEDSCRSAVTQGFRPAAEKGIANRAPMSCRRQRLASLIRVPAAWHLSSTPVPRIHLSLDGDGGVALPGPQTATSSRCGRATALRDEGERAVLKPPGTEEPSGWT